MVVCVKGVSSNYSGDATHKAIIQKLTNCNGGADLPGVE